ncbi:MAG: hypothetical protein HYX26_01675 [Acidobacteriales bacterium]|nr:hypothetical protein [Terriglobales bacterium]
MSVRSFVPHIVINGKPTVWHCSHCVRYFLNLDGSEETTVEAQREFEAHSCEEYRRFPFEDAATLQGV